MTMGRTAVRCPAILALCFMCIGIWDPILGEQVLEIKNITATGELHGDARINCTVSPSKASVDWLYKGKTFVTDDRKTINWTLAEMDGVKTNISTITIKNVTFDDVGNYTCVATLNEEKYESSAILSFNGKLISITTSPVRVNVSESPNITCIFEVFEAKEMKWYKKGEADKFRNIPLIQRNGTYVFVGSHTPVMHNAYENGTYVCEIEGTDSLNGTDTIYGTVDILVYDKPNVFIDVIAINTTELYMNWTLQTFNSEIVSYSVLLRKNKTSFIHHCPIKVGQNGTKNTSFIIENLDASTMYDVKLEVKTMHGSGFSNIVTVTTLATLDEPVFIPNISINGFSATAVTIGWTAPNEQKKKYIHYYLLEARKKDEERTMNAYHPRDDRNLPYMFDSLKPHSTYVFKVRACADYGGSERCGEWSEEMEAATLDGLPSEPTNVTVHCDRDFMELWWSPPANPNAEIKGYTMELRGQAMYMDRYGLMKNSTWGPLSKFKTNSSTNVRFDDLQPNTLYTVQISAMTRTRRRGVEKTASCMTLKAPPNQPPKPRWWKIQENDEFRFKMYLPRVSERNGQICCYRIYMVRLHPNSEDWNKLNSPNDLPVIDYKMAHGTHAEPPPLGAYVADVITNKQFPEGSEIILGDSKTLFNISDTTYSRPECEQCREKPERLKPTTTTITTTTTTTTTTVSDDFSTDDDMLGETASASSQPEAPPSRRRRNTDNIYSQNAIMKDKEKSSWEPEDGPLDPAANYTLFVELISGIDNELPLYSNFVNTLRPIATPTAPPPPAAIEIALQATCGIAALVLLLMIIFCIRQTRRSRKTPAHAQYELDAFRRAYKFLRGGRPQAVPPPHMPPVPRALLAAAYAERQADSDFGFQKEFELLPECFSDRTTHASDARENQPKNRYPDIKAYDQTRVKLSQIDGITGSDYINANYVNGYQDRKRFICAQGPTDTTVNDFWRMIWEHGLELIVMLTNLEEYSKVKCSKYWPDEGRGARAFGNINVTHVSERRYSDYIVRELKVTKQPLTTEGQPIVENNGVAKRNGDCKEAGDGSAPTSPREVKEESRIVKQYHFLMWKDFAAPEHAYSILKFIKRVNEAWSHSVVRPCVVHCSAGVGRTGTLVALDCLLEQLRAEGHAAVFNTVAELRRARNFLVQSPKQYIFVYRALVEYAHYGDTEIQAGRLKTAIDRLRNTPPGGTACLMEVEFEKILNSPIPEPVKSCAAGAAEELRPKNRSQDILPYDRNRVILAPIPTREFSTYINASFIEAYDNSESFIITQDPLPSTIPDFWRMVSEHNVSTIVMLSELGDGKCPRYWDDGMANYDHISVQYEESESCPYYTRRQFRLINNKCGTTQSVVALQYQGWPTAVGAVPEVTRGLAELADAAASNATTMLAHCQLGTERSALFVALCILIWQLRTERRVDVCSVARKVRSQRASTIDTFLHYEFLHRAILNYAELHNLLEDS